MPRDNEHIEYLTGRVHALMEGEQAGDVIMVCIAVLMNVIKQAPKKDRDQIVPFIDGFWKKLSKAVLDAS